MTPVYHLEGEVRKNKHYLVLVSSKTADRRLISAEESFDVLKSLSGSCFYQGKKVVVDPFSCFALAAELNYESADTAYLTLKLQIGSQEILLQKADWVFPGEPSWALISGIVRVIKGKLPAKEGLLEGKELFYFLDKAEGVISIEKKNYTAIEPTPFLQLTDRHGAFANLGFHYGKLGDRFSHDFASTPWRNKDAEKGWEQDLLETGFLKKVMENSHYYCPLDQVTKSLTFLLEIGWKIFDVGGRLVHRKKGSDIHIALQDKEVVVQGKLSYGDHEVDLEHVVGAFVRKERFLEIAPAVVALIDQEQLSQEGLAVTRLPKKCVGELTPLLNTLAYDHQKKLRELIERIPPSPIHPSPAFQGQLFPYQQKGLQWLSCTEGGLLADEMGLGKTVQLLAFFSTLVLTSPILIVVPTSLVFNWEREFRQFLPGYLEKKSILIVSYARLRHEAAHFSSMRYQVVILDEAQTIKNPESQIATICSTLQADVKIAVTGTPIENRLDDLWSIFRFIQPGLLGERKEFSKEMTEKMRRRLAPYILRRTKEEVGLDLPAKLEQTVYVQMSEQESAAYDSLLSKTREKRDSSYMEILEAILRLRQFCAHPRLVDCEGGAKLERVMADLAEVVQEGRKVLVYSQFTQMLGHMEQQVKAQGWNYAYLDGSTKDREEEVSRFQNDPSVSIFLISLKAGGVGLNLTAADYVFLYDPWWNVAVENQAIDRAHRLGRTATVIARRYTVALSIEEKIMTLKQHKESLLQALFAEGDLGALSREELVSLL